MKRTTFPDRKITPMYLVLTLFLFFALLPPPLKNNGETSWKENLPLRGLDTFSLFPAGSPYQLGLIGEGTEYETPYYIFAGKKEGPTVLIEAGIHGDELAGTYALDQLLYQFRVGGGKLILFPRMNLPACRQQTRFINVDLNKVFHPQTKGKAFEYHLAREIYNFVDQQGVEYLLTLHESRYLHDPDRPQTYGQTIVYGVDPMPEYLPDWIQRTNNGKATDKETFHPYYYPIEGSSTETMVEAFQLKGGFCVETWRGFPIEARVRLQRKVILSFLETIDFDYSLTTNNFRTETTAEN